MDRGIELWLLAWASAACACTPSVFQCQDDSGCDGGRCEPTGYCSFPDDACPSGRRYGEFAGDGVGGACVDDPDPSTTGIDGSESTAMTTLQPASTTLGEQSSTSTGSEDGSESTSAEPTCPPDWWDCAWTQRQRVALQAMPLDEPLERLPLPARVAPTVFDDDSLVFVDAAGQPLAWQRDGDIAWVGVDVEPDAQTEVWAYFGNASPGPVPAMSPFSESFAAVWHLSDGADATGSKNVAVSKEVTYDAGVFESAAVFDGVDDRYDVAASPALADLRDEGFTVEARFKPSETFADGYRRIIDKSDVASSTIGWTLMVRGDAPMHDIEINYGYLVDERQYVSEVVEMTDWVHLVVVTHPGDVAEFWIDGQQVAATLQTPGSGEITSDADQAVTIGAPTTGAGLRFFDGMIDELRVSRGVRSPSWVMGTYTVGRPEAVTVSDIEVLEVGVPAR